MADDYCGTRDADTMASWMLGGERRSHEARSLVMATLDKPTLSTLTRSSGAAAAAAAECVVETSKQVRQTGGQRDSQRARPIDTNQDAVRGAHSRFGILLFTVCSTNRRHNQFPSSTTTTRVPPTITQPHVRWVFLLPAPRPGMIFCSPDHAPVLVLQFIFHVYA